MIVSKYMLCKDYLILRMSIKKYNYYHYHWFTIIVLIKHKAHQMGKFFPYSIF
jgi:hypothetical protein